MIMHMAARNLWRNRRRTMITASSVAFGVWLAMLFIGTRNSSYQKLIDISARTGFGTVTMAGPGFFDGSGKAPRLANASALAHMVSTEPGVRAAVPRTTANAILTTANRNTGAVMFGVEPRSESSDTSIYLESLQDGRPPDAGDSDGGIIGQVMAERLGVQIGSKIVYTTTDSTGQMTSHVAHVQGIFSTGSTEMDGHVMVLPLSGLSPVLRDDPAAAGLIAVYPEAGADQEELYSRLKAKYSSAAVEVIPWQVSQTDLSDYVTMDRAMYRILVVFVAVIIAGGILNTMMINIVERRRELGVMLAVGLPPSGLFAMVLLEAGLIGGLGLGLGLIAVAPFYVYLNRVGVDFTAMLGDRIDAGSVVVRLVVNCRLSQVDCLGIALALLAMTLLAAVYPAAKAALTVPVKTMKES